MKDSNPNLNTEAKNEQVQYNKFYTAALIRGPQFYKYQQYSVPFSENNQQNYEIIEKIGRGKYSDVFKCINVKDDRFYVLKILKPVREQKIKREIKILNQLNHENIVKLYETIYDQSSKCYCLVFEYVKTADYRDLIETINQDQIRAIMFQLLQGLKYCHSRGIMHRDIKPQNLLIDAESLTVKISDWGLADYFLPQTDYNVRVASRHYKGPQLLLNNKRYDFSLDIWSLGLVFSGFLFRTYTIFRGDDNPDQLKEIMKHFGSQEITSYVKKYNLQPDEQTMTFIRQSKNPKRRPWSYYISKENEALCDPIALDLLDKMLQIDHKKRINVIDALQHTYFKAYNFSGQ